ncbi:MAG: hypothetical protein GY835_14655 [bacterium]|nr:hypothetical protein [bacterium]
MATRLRNLPRLLLHLLVLRPLLHLIFGLSVRGQANLPERGPFILAANHNSHLDILMLCAALPVRLLGSTHVVAARDYFSRFPRLFAVIDYLLRPVWVDRGTGGKAALEKMGELLDRGENIIIFPEGTRGEAGKLARFHSGVGRLVVTHPEAQLVPAFLLGSERALPRNTALPLLLWHHVNIGPPQSISGDGGDITQALRESIIDLGSSRTAARHRRRPERRRGLTIAVLGIDGSGKSTLSRRLCAELSVGGGTCLIGDSLDLYSDGEPRAAQPLVKEKLRRWMSAQAKDAKSLARYKIPKLAELLLRDALLGEAKRWYGPDLIFMDGSPLLNMTAWSVLYRPQQLSVDFCARAMSILAGRGSVRDPLYAEFPELRHLRRLGLTRLKLPDLILFLDVDPAVAIERIMSRGERVQVHETEEKLGRLREAYLLTVRAAREKLDLPAHVIEGGREPDVITAEARGLVTALRAERVTASEEVSR